MRQLLVLFEDKEVRDVFMPPQESNVAAIQLPVGFSCHTNKEKYIATVNKILGHIKRGDIYELNYCIEFFAGNVTIDPYAVFQKLKALTEAPFSRLLKTADTWIICASPERFIKKEGGKLITQPMKGTAQRGSGEEEDQKFKTALANSLKEQTENVMAVDVARNDLSIIAKNGTVVTEELFGVQTFKNVHQMVSTISCELKEDVDLDAIMDAVFPPASMTGAPKIKALELIKKYELGPRGIYSGCLGTIDDNGDFDLCVIIRTLLYEEKQKRISFHVGSAITSASDPEEEWNECLLKADALLRALDTNSKEIKFLK